MKRNLLSAVAGTRFKMARFVTRMAMSLENRSEK